MLFRQAFLLLLVVSFVTHQMTDAVVCYKSRVSKKKRDDGRFGSATCVGDYCYSALYHMATVKGCVSTNLELTNTTTRTTHMVARRMTFEDGTHITDEGYRYDETIYYCNGKDLCNVADALHQSNSSVDVQYQRCSLSVRTDTDYHDFLADSSFCMGEICIYATTADQSAVKQGCFDLREARTNEYHLYKGCFKPGFPAMSRIRFSLFSQNLDTILDLETCMCDEGLCNQASPKRQNTSVDPKSRCTMKATFEVLGVESVQTTIERSCEGDYCFDLTDQRKLNGWTTFGVQGCFTMLENSENKWVKPGFWVNERMDSISKIRFWKNVANKTTSK